MFDIQNYWSFVIAILVFQAVPGAGTIAIVNAAARGGVRAGSASVLGTVLGDCLFMVAGVAGLAAVMRENPRVFEGLQWLGAAYLCWMGVQLLRTRFTGAVATAEQAMSPASYFRQALTVSLTNPKVILFFVAFFPLFLQPDAPLSTLLIMMAHVTVLSLAYQFALVVIGNAAARKLESLPSARKIATRMAGVALIGFGVKLAINNR